MIVNGATLAVEASGGGLVEPTALIMALAQRHEVSGEPSGLTLMFCTGIGDREGAGLDYLARPGLVCRTIGGHYGYNPRLGQMVLNGEIEGFNLPQGVMAQLYREIAGGRPGVITKVGLNTFCDPRLEGGRLSNGPTDSLISVVEVAGDEWLLYRALPIDCAFIRGTTIDERGNLTLEHEAATLGVLPLATAAHNSGGASSPRRSESRPSTVSRHGMSLSQAT